MSGGVRGLMVRLRLLEARMARTQDPDELRHLLEERDALRAEQRELIKGKPAKKKRASTVPVPRSYIEERREKNETASQLSGRKRIRARFVQGGSVSGK